MGSTKIHGMIFASLFHFSFPSSRIFICLSSLHCSYRLLLQQNKQGITTLSSWHSWQRQVLFSVSFASLEWEDTTTDYHPVSHYEWNSDWGTREGRDRTVDKMTTTTTGVWSQREREREREMMVMTMTLTTLFKRYFSRYFMQFYSIEMTLRPQVHCFCFCLSFTVVFSGLIITRSMTVWCFMNLLEVRIKMRVEHALNIKE